MLSRDIEKMKRKGSDRRRVLKALSALSWEDRNAILEEAAMALRADPEAGKFLASSVDALARNVAKMGVKTAPAAAMLACMAEADACGNLG